MGIVAPATAQKQAIEIGEKYKELGKPVPPNTCDHKPNQQLAESIANKK